MIRKKFIFITTQFEAFHRYANAPDEVSYLRNLHRHMFHVKATIEVFHHDRELEFIMVKHKLDEQLAIYLEDANVGMSCEQIAEYLYSWIEDEYGASRHVIVEVNEDNENGAIVGDY